MDVLAADGPARGSPQARSAALLTALALGSFVWLQLARVDASLPYPQNWDESPILAGAGRVVRDGELNPHVYSYPSLPVYIAAASLALGYVALNGESAKRVPIAELGRLASPFYEQPQAVAWVRKTWVIMFAGALLALATAAGRLAGPWAMVLCALLSLTGTAAAFSAWNYVNVDIPLVLFSALLVLHLVSSAGSALLRDRVGIPALLCGAAIACKYTAVVLLIPCAIALWAWSERERGLRLILFVAAALAGFLVLCPYFLLDLPRFLEGLAFENHHYRSRGHSGMDGTPGWPQLLRYLGFLGAEYGLASSGFALAGVVALSRARRVEAIVLLVMAIAWLGFLSRYKVFFVRNALPVSGLVPLLAAIGVVAAFRALRQWCARRSARALALRPGLIAGLVCAGMLILTVPYAKLAASFSAVDSRNRLAAFAVEHLQAKSRLLIPAALPVAAFTLPRSIQIRVVAFTRPDEVRGHLRRVVNRPMYALVPHFSERSGWVESRVTAERAGIAVLPASRRVVASFPGTPLIPVREGEVCVNPSFDLVRLDAAP